MAIRDMDIAAELMGIRPFYAKLTAFAASSFIVGVAGAGRAITPAAEWLIDNYHLVEKQIRQIRSDLPAGYYQQLPKLIAGPFVGYPRVFGLAWSFVAHTDSRFDTDMLLRYLVAYQEVQPLTIGELWAVSITLRIVLIENLGRLAEQQLERTMYEGALHCGSRGWLGQVIDGGEPECQRTVLERGHLRR